MIERPEFAYLLANAGFVAVGGYLAALSFRAHYRRPEQRSYAIAGLGFACLLLAGVVESGYTFLVATDYVLSSTGYLILQAGDDAISALALGLFLLAIARHRPGVSNPERVEAQTDEYWQSGKPFDE